MTLFPSTEFGSKYVQYNFQYLFTFTSRGYQTDKYLVSFNSEDLTVFGFIWENLWPANCPVDSNVVTIPVV